MQIRSSSTCLPTCIGSNCIRGRIVRAGDHNYDIDHRRSDICHNTNFEYRFRNYFRYSIPRIVFESKYRICKRATADEAVALAGETRLSSSCCFRIDRLLDARSSRVQVPRLHFDVSDVETWREIVGFPESWGSFTCSRSRLYGNLSIDPFEFECLVLSQNPIDLKFIYPFGFDFENIFIGDIYMTRISPGVDVSNREDSERPC